MERVSDDERAWFEAMMLREEIGEFRLGLYRHYKGGLYTALGIVTHHEKRLPMVKYVSHTYGGESVRPLLGWPGDPDGWTTWVENEAGVRVPRFAFVGELPSDTPIEKR